jgi:hypothetical protein
MTQNNELIQCKIIAIQQKLNKVVNPVPLDDNFILQQFVARLHDKVKTRQQTIEACLDRTKSSSEFDLKVTEALEKVKTAGSKIDPEVERKI